MRRDSATQLFFIHLFRDFVVHWLLIHFMERHGVLEITYGRTFNFVFWTERDCSKAAVLEVISKVDNR